MPIFQITPLPLVLQIALATLVVLAAAFDYRRRRIPNWLSLAGLIVGFSLNSALGGFPGLLQSVSGFLLGFAVYLVLYLLRAMGAGDVKLMAAVGSMAGPGRWFTIFILTSVIGGITALVLLLFRKRTRQTLWNTGFVVSQLMRFRAPHSARGELDVRSPNAVTLPAGVRIAAGVLAFHLISVLWGK